MAELMDEAEFGALIQRLHTLSATDGDIGHAYWTRVIGQLREMRLLAERAIALVPHGPAHH